MDNETQQILETYDYDTIIDNFSKLLTQKRVSRFKNIIDHRITDVSLVIEKLYDSLNASAILRTCEAFGLLNVHFIAPEEKYDLSKKITISAHKWLTIKDHKSTEDAVSYFNENGFTQWASIPPFPGRPKDDSLVKITANLRDIPLNKKIAIWVGNEREGLSDKLLELVENKFTIPMFGLTQSLNISVSTGIMLENIVHRIKESNRPGGLSDFEKKQLLAKYLIEDIENPTTTLEYILNRKS